MLAGCGLSRYATPSERAPAARAWERDHDQYDRFAWHDPHEPHDLNELRGGLMWPRFGELVMVELPEAPAGTLAGLVGDTGPVLLDLRVLPRSTRATAWFAQPRFMRSVGGAEHVRVLRRGTALRGWGFYVPREAFDAVLVLPTTGPIHPWFAGGR